MCLPLWAGAAPLEAGMAWPYSTLKDQFDQPLVVDATTRQIIFTAEKSVSGQLTSVLSAQGKEMLAKTHTVVIADISAMPAVITRMFAVPKLRELPYSLVLVREAFLMADLPRRKGAATVLTLDKGQITRVQYLQTEAQLRLALAP